LRDGIEKFIFYFIIKFKIFVQKEEQEELIE